MSTQRKISAADLDHLMAVPNEAQPTAMWLWLNLDPLGRGLLNERRLAAALFPTMEPNEATATMLSHLLMLMEAGFLTTYRADGQEWLLLLHPLKTDLRRVKITTPEPPHDAYQRCPESAAANRPWTSMAGGRGAGARARDGAWERARAEARAESAARSDAWDAVVAGRAESVERPDRPPILDAPPMFCEEHMPYGAGKTKCGPCRDRRNFRDEWMARQVYETKLAEFYERQEEQQDEPEGWDSSDF